MSLLRTVEVVVTQSVVVTVDVSKFTEEWMAEFRESFYPFFTLEDHLKHLGQLRARGLDRDFIEGYGPAKDMGIVFEDGYQEEEVSP